MQIESSESGIYAMGAGQAGEVNTSGVSWGAVFAGAAAAAALSLILLILGVGLGLSSVSPWSYNVGVLGASTIAWLEFTQLAASGLGGYLAGRLRVKWTGVHTDEAHFRDTAHGLLTWAVATLFTAALLAGAARVIVSGAIDAGTGVANAVAPAAAAAASKSSDNSGEKSANPADYFSSMLLRTDQEGADANRDARLSEVNKIFLTNMRSNKLAADDRDYLAKMVAKRTGMSQPDAERRVDDVYARYLATTANAEATAKQAAEKARKAAAHSALWTFIALLLGAFVASVAATVGGRQRDGLRVRG